MKHFRTGLAAFAALALLTVGGSRARADLALTLQEDNGTVVTVQVPLNTGPATFSGDLNTTGAVAIGDFTIFLSIGSSNSPGTSGSALTSAATITITNNTSTNHTLHINASAQGFTTPNSPPPLTVMDTVSGSLVSGSVSGDFQGFVDTSNTLFGTASPAPLLTFSASGMSQSIAVNGHSATPFNPNGSTYSMTIKSNFTLGGHSSLTLTGGNVQAIPTPEPSTLASGFVGLGLLGGLGWLRRRSRPA